MQLGNWDTIGGPGILPLGVKGAHSWTKATSWLKLLWERPCMMGTRIDNSASLPFGGGRQIDQLGHFVYDQEWNGDILGAHHWKAAKGPQGRDVGVWRWSTPVKIVSIPRLTISVTQSGTTSAWVGQTQESGLNVAGTAQFIRPILQTRNERGGDHSWPVDKRLKAIDVGDPRPYGVNVESNSVTDRYWPVFPLGWHGIMQTSNWEDDQDTQEMFLPTDPRLIAQNRGNTSRSATWPSPPGAFGSYVTDIYQGREGGGSFGEAEVNHNLNTSLQSMMWILRKPRLVVPCKGTVGEGLPGDDKFENHSNAIGWNIGWSGGKENRGGFIVDRDSWQGVITTPTGIFPPGGTWTNLNPNGSFSITDYGPQGKGFADPGGSVSDIPVGLVSQRQSGPFELRCRKHQLGETSDGQPIFSTHLSMNTYFTFPQGWMDGPLKHDGAWAGADDAPETAFVFFNYDETLEHDWVGKPKKYGKHRWWAQTNKYTPPTHIATKATAAGPNNPLMVGASPLGALSNTEAAGMAFALMAGNRPFTNAMSRQDPDPRAGTPGAAPLDYGASNGPGITTSDPIPRPGGGWYFPPKPPQEIDPRTGKPPRYWGGDPDKGGLGWIPGYPTPAGHPGGGWNEGGPTMTGGGGPTSPWGGFGEGKDPWDGSKPGDKPNKPTTGWGEGQEPPSWVGGPWAGRPPKPPITPPKPDDGKQEEGPNEPNPPGGDGGGDGGDGGGGGGGGGNGGGGGGNGGGPPPTSTTEVPPTLCGGTGYYAQAVGPYIPSDQRAFLAFQFSTMEEGGLAYIWRPQRFQRREIDWKKWRKPDRDFRRRTIDLQSPITARFEAFGAQGARHTAGDNVLDMASDWVYTHRPNSYRYLSGTANGGVCMTSPEVDLADWDTGLAPLTGAAQSTTHFVAGRGTRFGAGLPDLFLGGMEEGYSWYDDGAGSLTFSTNVESTATERVKFDVNGCVGIGGESYGGALGSVVFIANASRAPVSNPSGGGILYVTAGALTYRGSSGTVTTLAPA